MQSSPERIFHHNLLVFPCLFSLLTPLWTSHITNPYKNSISLLHAQDDEMGDLQPSMFVLLLDDAEDVCYIAEDHGMK